MYKIVDEYITITVKDSNDNIIKVKAKYEDVIEYAEIFGISESEAIDYFEDELKFPTFPALIITNKIFAMNIQRKIQRKLNKDYIRLSFEDIDKLKEEYIKKIKDEPEID